MNNYLLSLALCLLSFEAPAIPWPMIQDSRITSCESGPQGPCSHKVYFANSGTIFSEVVATGKPNAANTGTRVRTIGVHCEEGNALTGDLPFRKCVWRPGHSPNPVSIWYCQLESLTSWKLSSTAAENCPAVGTWGSHSGAGPGAECVVYTNTNLAGSDLASVNTPWGMLDAGVAANSGNRYCYKPLPPNVQCELGLPAVIEHGVVQAGQSSKRDDDGYVDCGGTPKIDVLVNGDRDVDGVRIYAMPRIVNATTVRITSEISVSSSAVPREHSATYVFVASPY